MAVVNDQFKYVFLAEEHTGSRAMTKALMEIPGSRIAGRHHITLKQLLDRRYLQPRLLKSYTVFCVVRNPADIMVTRWILGSDQRSTPFRRYIRRVIEAWPNPNKVFFKHAHTADSVLKYERLETDLKQLSGQLVMPMPTLQVVGKTPEKESWETYYTSDDLNFMLERYPEITKFGYIDIIKRNIRAKLREEELTS